MGRNVGVQVLRGIKANIPTLLAGEVYFCTDTQQLFIGTSGGNDLLAPMFVYNTSGVRQLAHIVTGSVTCTSNSQVVTLSGAAVFTSATSYVVIATEQTANHTIQVTQTSGSQFTLKNQANNDVVNFICIGT